MCEQRAKRTTSTDHLGSANIITDYEGGIYEHIEYTPYGELWEEQKSDVFDRIPFRFTGKELDDETALYYYGARYLDPRTSRWISSDPAGFDLINPNDNPSLLISGLNWYSYTENNPIRYTDPTGMEPVYAGMDSNYYYSGNKTPHYGKNQEYANTQTALVGGNYVFGGNDPAVDGGVDCSGGPLFGLREMGYDIPDMTADQIVNNLTVPVEDGEYKPGDIRALHDSKTGEVDHLQTMLEDGRVNPAGDDTNKRNNPGKIEKLEGSPPSSGTLHRLDWDSIDKNYGQNTESKSNWRDYTRGMEE